MIASKILINYKISTIRVFFVIFLLYVSTTILTPKIDFGFVVVYPFEPFLILISIYLLIKKKIMLITNIEKSYFLFIFISMSTFFLGVINTDIVDTKAVLLIIKFFSFGFIISISYYFVKYMTESLFEKIIFIQLLFVIVYGSYVIYNFIFFPISMGDIIWGYSQEYRLIGFTGYGLSIDGIRAIGNTSVQTGIFVGLLFLLYLSHYVLLNKKKYLIFMIIAFVGELLTQSRSGLLIVFVGVLYIIFDKYNNIKLLKIFSSTVFLLTFAIYYMGLWEDISTFGTIGKIVSSEGYQDGSALQRLKYMSDAFEYISESPFGLIFGTGYGEGYTLILIGTPFLENLIFTALFQSGIIAFFVVLSIFYFMWHYARKLSNTKNHNIYSATLYGVKLFIPGFFIANSIGGNSLQTDFIVPFFFFIMGTTIYKQKKEKI
ncbi:MAG: hypothetical protein KU28_00455 [Sulfurovum sp. PC08-66]|nr:MAG: hypothetical protein KU28_00455 [Sulfurovum sp. PC08-66]KIM12440.1 MAG: hypothetical protein KU37_00575 [Sulfuricurvum sp. PC08-66]